MITYDLYYILIYIAGKCGDNVSNYSYFTLNSTNKRLNFTLHSTVPTLISCGIYITCFCNQTLCET